MLQMNTDHEIQQLITECHGGVNARTVYQPSVTADLWGGPTQTFETISTGLY